MCLNKLRAKGKSLQTRYENLIADKNLYGFSNLYVQAMNKLKEHKGEAS
jgi:hypothetical protein